MKMGKDHQILLFKSGVSREATKRERRLIKQVLYVPEYPLYIYVLTSSLSRV